VDEQSREDQYDSSAEQDQHNERNHRKELCPQHVVEDHCDNDDERSIELKLVQHGNEQIREDKMVNVEAEQQVEQRPEVAECCGMVLLAEINDRKFTDNVVIFLPVTRFLR